MLSQTDIERYRADGHVVPDYRVPEEVLGEIRAGHDRLIAKHPEFAERTLFLMRGQDRSGGRNDYRVRY